MGDVVGSVREIREVVKGKKWVRCVVSDGWDDSDWFCWVF